LHALHEPDLEGREERDAIATLNRISVALQSRAVRQTLKSDVTNESRALPLVLTDDLRCQHSIAEIVDNPNDPGLPSTLRRVHRTQTSRLDQRNVLFEHSHHKTHIEHSVCSTPLEGMKVKVQHHAVRRALLAVIASALVSQAPLTSQAHSSPATQIVSGPALDLSGTFHPGDAGQVAWRVIKPPAWNGTLVLDLDFAPTGYNVTQRTWFLERGYAIGGIQRTQNETAYELKKYVDDLIQVRHNLIEAGAGEPYRTIAFGASRGGFVARMAVQYRPDIFKGAVAFAGGGSGVLAAWLGKAEAVWALKTLVDPSAPLAINNLPDIPVGSTYGPNYQQDVALVQLVATARATPQGMARLVLAAALEQATGWPSGSAQPTVSDYETQGNLIAGSFAFGNPQFVHKEIEVMAGGPIVWNHGVDYRISLLRSGDLERVRYWYAKAGLDVEEDLRTLNRASRFSAEPAAVQRVEQIGTFTGRTGGPVLSIKTLGDSADSVSLDEAYERTFHAAGTSRQLRTAFIARAGHSTQTLRERLTAFATLIERLDEHRWPDTRPAALNARGAVIAAGTSIPDADLGATAYVPYEPVAALRTWDFTNWGEYLASYVDSLSLRHDWLYGLALDGFAHHLQRGQTRAACTKLSLFELLLRTTKRDLTAAQLNDLLSKSRRLEDEIGCR
jgi:pimeloyl-ACP methyl ester carboxylesterase